MSDTAVAAMQAEVERLVALLKKGVFDAAEQDRFLATTRSYVDLDKQAPQAGGTPASPHLDRWLGLLGSRSFPRSSFATAYQDIYAILTDAIRQECDPPRQAEFDRLVALSALHRGRSVEAAPENFWTMLGREEALGLRGMLKSMGTGAAGLADVATWALVRQAQALHLPVSDPPSLAEWLARQYDLSGDALFGEAYQDSDSAAIGEAGGTVVWTLTTLGAGAAGQAGRLAAVGKILAGVGIVGNFKGVEDGAREIAAAVERLQAQDKLTLAELTSDPGFVAGVTRLAASAFAALAARTLGSADASRLLVARLAKVQVLLEAASLAPIVMRMIEVAGSNLKPSVKNREMIRLAGELAAQIISALSSANDAIKASGAAEAEANRPPPPDDPGKIEQQAPPPAPDPKPKARAKKPLAPLEPNPRKLRVSKKSPEKGKGGKSRKGKKGKPAPPPPPEDNRALGNRLAAEQPGMAWFDEASFGPPDPEPVLLRDAEPAAPSGVWFEESDFGPLASDPLSPAERNNLNRPETTGFDPAQFPDTQPDARRGWFSGPDDGNLTARQIRDATTEDPRFPADLSQVRRGAPDKNTPEGRQALADTSGANTPLRRASGSKVVTRDKQIHGFAWGPGNTFEQTNEAMRAWAHQQLPPGQPDPILGQQWTVKQASPDHIIPVEIIKQLPMFAQLSTPDQMRVIYFQDNLLAIDLAVNSARGSTPYAQLTEVTIKGVTYPVPPGNQTALRALEVKAMAAIKAEISRLYQQDMARAVTPDSRGLGQPLDRNPLSSLRHGSGQADPALETLEE